MEAELTQHQTGEARGLIDYLAGAGQEPAARWRQWRLRRIDGGGNNLLYRATSDAEDLAVKFTARDERDRAGREFDALLTLQRAGLAIAPRPVLLDRERYPTLVVVQTWLDGPVSATPPVDDADWRRWVEHLATVHTVTPDGTPATLRPAVLTMTSAAEGRERIRQQVDLIPPAARPSDLCAIVRRIEEHAFPTWPPPRLALSHGDNNIRNVVRRPERWAAVDWEYSGWGDPAFDIAELVTHAAHVRVPPERWEWVIAAYGAPRDDRHIARRIRVYRTLLLGWWVARLARRLHEVPRGKDQRLVAPPADWQADCQAKYEHYLAAATRALSE